MTRGRPKLAMTRRRRQVLEVLSERRRGGERISLGHIMRRCGFYGREDVKRVLRDLMAMDRVPNPAILPHGLGDAL